MVYLRLEDNIVVEELNYNVDGSDAPASWVVAPDPATYSGGAIGKEYVEGALLDIIISVEALRAERDLRLAECDWRDLPSYQGADQTEWRTYRQVLRDITEGYTPTRVSPIPNVPGYVEPVIIQE